ncbi:MAG TPA: UDP-N-acetylmuramoyl-tripeptide--D-alanyl-D-alanine ligase [Patescibacteria group bacterium]|nr:UDP-N-acetylmuramoyl-tripeptide--D-alanyl-D-alanine ligase [Patescibacteria group bacterium]
MTTDPRDLAAVSPPTRLTLARIAQAVGGSLLPSASGAAAATIPSGFSIDSRTLRKGDLFFAIVGPNHDGHAFIAEVLSRGAAAVVVSDIAALPVPGQGEKGAKGAMAIVVPDTLRALQDLAAFVRRGLAVKVVAITGSNGKTSTKEMTRQVLEAAFKVHASRGNLNNLFGCPLALLELNDQHQVSVLEMGMSYHGELSRLAEIADPDIGILTNVSGAHLAHFRDLDDVASAKGELFTGMRENSIGIFNNDDERCRGVMGGYKGYAFTFGMDRPSDLMAADYRMDGLEGSSFEARHVHNGGSRRVTVKTRFVGRHHVYNALAAMSAGYMLGIDLEAMASRLADLQPVGMRGRVGRLKQSVRVLDESYNSNPASMLSTLQVLADMPRSADPAAGRRIVVFGDMLELGDAEAEAHREMGLAIAASGVDLLVGIGPLARLAVKSASDSMETRGFDTSTEAAPAVAALAKPGDVFLVKGSRGVALEKIVNALKQRFGEE